MTIVIIKRRKNWDVNERIINETGLFVSHIDISNGNYEMNKNRSDPNIKSNKKTRISSCVRKFITFHPEKLAPTEKNAKITRTMVKVLR